MRVIDIHLMPWKWDGLVYTGGTSTDFAAYVKRDLDMSIETGSGAAGHAYLEEGKPWVIWVESPKNLPTLAHEALHITGGILEARGLKFSGDSEEAYTYTMEDILRQVLAPRARWRHIR